MLDNYKMNPKIWKNQQEFDKYYDIFINTPKRKKKNCSIKINNSKWSSLTSFHRHYGWQAKSTRKERKPRKPRIRKIKIDYKTYITSKQRYRKRKDFFIKANYTCECCLISYKSKNLRLHHNTYARVWKEKLKDLNVVCIICHENIHFEKWIKVKLNKKILRARFNKLKLI
jgi:hypothetical protein